MCVVIIGRFLRHLRAANPNVHAVNGSGSRDKNPVAAWRAKRQVGDPFRRLDFTQGLTRPGQTGGKSGIDIFVQG